MKHIVTRSLILGAALSLFPGIGAAVSQTNFLSEPTIVKAAEWEPIRTHEVTVQYWWEIEYGNDPDIPDEIEEAAILAGTKYGIAPELLEAMGETESRYDATADNNGNYLGWLQVSPRWHAARLADMGLDSEDLFDPTCCALIAADYLDELFEKYEDPALVLMAYNGDSSGIRRYYKTGVASKYATTILNRAAELERKHGK